MSSDGPVLTEPLYLELKDRFAGALVLVLAMASCVCFSFWAKEVARPELDMQKSPASIRGIVGWPHAVDGLGTLEVARRSSRPRELRRIVFDGVKSDGTIDVVTSPGQLSYLFHNGLKRPKPRKPIPAPGNSTAPGASSAPSIASAGVDDAGRAAADKVGGLRALFEKPERPMACPRQTVRVRHDGLDSQSELKDYRCPEVFYEPLPTPSCGPRQLWARAIEKGASIRQLAHIEYYRSKSGPAWKMQLPRDRTQLMMSSDCQRELDRAEGAAIGE